jgi:hypothetical protein
MLREEESTKDLTGRSINQYKMKPPKNYVKFSDEHPLD